MVARFVSVILNFIFETDVFRQNIMDDANLPSLLSASMMGYVNPRDEVYLNTRLFALSDANPYWAFGKVFNAIGGPHLGPTKAWPLASIVRVLTSESEDESRDELRGLLGSTDGLGKPRDSDRSSQCCMQGLWDAGLVHESINSWDVKDWSRQW